MSWRRRYEFAVVAELREMDKYGNPMDPPTRRTIRRCVDWPDTSSEDDRGAVQTSESRTLSLPPGEAVIPSDWDVVYPDGRRWKIVGEPYAYRRGVILTIERRS